MSTTDSNTTVPLTTTQKMWLAVSFLPVIFFVLVLIFSLTILPTTLPPSAPPLVPIFTVVILLVMIYQAGKSLRDILSGVALVEEDELVRSWHSRGENSRRYGQFARLGRLQMSRRAFGQGQSGQRYRVCYSPASRVVWSLETK